jgi:hypothetical protein
MQYKLLLSKRGATQKIPEWLLIPLGWLFIIIFFILIPLLLISDDIKENTIFDRNLLVADLATISTALSNKPVDSYIDYPGDTLWFSYIIEESKVKAVDGSNILVLESNHVILEDKNLNYVYAELNPKFKNDIPSEENLIQPVKIRISKEENVVGYENLNAD